MIESNKLLKKRILEQKIMAFQAVTIQDISGSQMIKIPENFKINDDKVYLKKVGNTLYIIPFHNPWQSMLDSVNEFSEDFMTEWQQPSQQSREPFD
jgi:antitoxin VapB